MAREGLLEQSSPSFLPTLDTLYAAREEEVSLMAELSEVEKLQREMESLKAEVLALRSILIVVTQNALTNSGDYTNSGPLRTPLKDRKALFRLLERESSESFKTEYAYHLGEVLDAMRPYIEGEVR